MEDKHVEKECMEEFAKDGSEIMRSCVGIQTDLY